MGVCSPIIVRISHYWIGEGFRLLWYSFPVMIQFLDKNWPTFLILTLSLERGLIWPNNKMAFYGLKWPKRANYLACYRCLEAATAEPAAEEHLFSFFRGRFQTLHTDLARPRRAPGGGWVVISDALWQRGTAQYLPPSPPVPVPSASTLAHRDEHLGWTAHSRGLGNQILSRTVLSSHPNRQFLGFHPNCVCHKVNRECCFLKKNCVAFLWSCSIVKRDPNLWKWSKNVCLSDHSSFLVQSRVTVWNFWYREVGWSAIWFQCASWLQAQVSQMASISGLSTSPLSPLRVIG